ncbi:MAG TPA: glycerol-3-phosphate dehydrogenase/oxidase [Anaerolineae bacterium]
MMKRDVGWLAKSQYDVLVVGGGITGACVAWDATLRGLRIALVERKDFGGATSANSLKTIHGGLRYLQDANLGLVRKMVRERQAWLRIAPHLVHPLPVLMPSFKQSLARGRLVLGAAVRLNDLFGLDRNWRSDPQKMLPNGRILSRAECLQLLPGLNDASVSGGVLWHDAQMYNSERLLLSFLLSATEAGAQVANYVAVTDFLQEGRRVVGARARDELTGQELEIRAEVVVNATGPWVDEVLDQPGLPPQRPRFHLSTAMNLVTRQILPEYAVALTSTQLPDGSTEAHSRVLFIVPWRNYSLIGTVHAPFEGRPDDDWVKEKAIVDFVAEVNRAYPGACLRREDVYHVHRGFLPDVPGHGTSVKLIRESQVTDHQAESGIEGLVTVVGVKYTTARYAAEKVVDMVFKKLRRPSPRCQTRYARLYGGQIAHFDEFVTQAMEKWPYELPRYQLRRLLYNYGSAYRQLLSYFKQDLDCWQPLSDDAAVTKAEVLYSVHKEMAQKLSDVSLRRTELGAAGKPDEAGLLECARIMAAELDWDRRRIDREVNEVYDGYIVI